MRTDAFLRVVLTVIAACLVVLVMQAMNAEPTVSAAQSGANCEGELRPQSGGGYRVFLRCR